MILASLVATDLSNIPKLHNNYSWQNSIGCTFTYTYDSLSGNILIEDYDNGLVLCNNLTNGRKRWINCSNIPTGNIVTFVNYTGKQQHVLLKNKHYNLGSIIRTKFHTYRILSVKCLSYTKSNMSPEENYGKVHYDVMCLDCGCSFDVGTFRIQYGACPYCRGTRPIPNKTDIPTVAPWMIPYFQHGIDEAVQYTPTCGRKIIPKCPSCNKIHDKSVVIANLYAQHGFKCKCSDNISYPEKFIICLLDQLGISYVHQAQESSLGFSTNRKIYDFYIPKLSMIIETHGNQHYDARETIYNISYNYQTYNDSTKKELAIDNGVSNYIVLDCRKSTLNWIKNSVLNSELPKLLSFSENDIDWEMCSEYGTSNLAKLVCDYYNLHDVNTDELSNKFHIGKNGIRSYLKRGAELGWCIYKPITTFFALRPFNVYKDNEFICYGVGVKSFSLKSESILGMHLDYNGIRKCLIGTIPKFKGYQFKYIDDLQLKRQVIVDAG